MCSLCTTRAVSVNINGPPDMNSGPGAGRLSLQSHALNTADKTTTIACVRVSVNACLRVGVNACVRVGVNACVRVGVNACFMLALTNHERFTAGTRREVYKSATIMYPARTCDTAIL